MLRYGLDVKTPTTIPGDDPWKPVMESKQSRLLFAIGTDAVEYLDRMKAGLPSLEVRLVSVDDQRPSSRLHRLE